MMNKNLENLIREEYLSALYQQQILENLDTTEVETLFSEFVLSISEHFDLSIEEDAKIEDVLEAFSDWDLSDNETYQELIEAVKRKPRAKRKPARPAAKKPAAKKPAPKKPAAKKPTKVLKKK